MKYKKLTPEEERVILYKSTETPYSGQYEHFDKPGIFTCKRCGAYLYRSDDKFDAQCGWPSFDAEILGAVTHSPDADGMRTEITCARCNAHLGHVFTGEQFTPTNTRHCVNSISLSFTPKDKIDTSASAYFGGGCFWCTEAVFKQTRGVTQVTPGYAGGQKPNPDYQMVSAGTSGYAEVVKVDYNPTIISFEALLTIFFTSHDPTTPNQQGADIGTQYRSIILFQTELENELAHAYIKKLSEDQTYDASIITEIQPLKHFYPAENYHQNYYQNHQNQPYCQVIIKPKLEKLKKLRADYLIQM